MKFCPVASVPRRPGRLVALGSGRRGPTPVSDCSGTGVGPLALSGRGSLCGCYTCLPSSFSSFSSGSVSKLLMFTIIPAMQFLM